MALVGMDKINRQAVEIHASTLGRWSIKLDDLELGAGETLEGAKRAAGNELRRRRVKFRVDFVTHAGERGFVYALHAGSRNYMAEINGEKQQYDSYKVLRGDVPQEKIDEMLAATARAKAAERQAKAIANEYTLDLRAAVNAAIEAAQEAAVA